MRGLTELTREGEVPAWGVKWPVVSVEVISRPSPATVPATHIHVTYVRLGMIWEVYITVTN